MNNISDHITYNEATISNTAKAKGIDNTPNETQLANMGIVAKYIFEPVRTHFNAPIKVSSFFRCAELNVAVGGSKTSQHVQGCAIDMDGDVYGSPTNKQIFEYIRDNLEFDQLIIEGITNGKMAWVHCSYKESGNRGQVLFMYKKDGKSVYEAYSEKRYMELVK